VREELRQGLVNFTSEDGFKIAKRVYFKEELYYGKYTEHAPDLVVLSKEGYDLKGKVNSNVIFGRSNLQGMHTQDDAFSFSTNGAACKNIFDAKKIILDSFSETA
jgi:predicted AlkP superfamily phosphohydrolase/phosphomutase